MKVKYELVKIDPGELVFFNQNYKNNDKLEIKLFNSILVGSGLAIVILSLIICVLLAILVDTIFVGIILIVLIEMAILAGYTISQHGERRYILWETNDKYKIGKVYEFNTELKEIKNG